MMEPLEAIHNALLIMNGKLDSTSDLITNLSHQIELLEVKIIKIDNNQIDD